MLKMSILLLLRARWGFYFDISNVAEQHKLFLVLYINEGQTYVVPSFQEDIFYEISSSDASISMDKRSGRIATKYMLKKSPGKSYDS